MADTDRSANTCHLLSTRLKKSDQKQRILKVKILSYNSTKIFQKAQQNGPYFQFASHYSQSYCCLESSWQVVADKSASEQFVDDQSDHENIFSGLHTFL